MDTKWPAVWSLLPGYFESCELACAAMNDFDSPRPNASPDLQAGDLSSLPSATSASDPDRTPVNPFLVPTVDPGMLSTARELTPVTVPAHQVPLPYRPPMETMPGLFAPAPRRAPAPPTRVQAAPFEESESPFDASELPFEAHEDEAPPSSVVTSARLVPSAPRPAAPQAAAVHQAAAVPQAAAAQAGTAAQMLSAASAQAPAAPGAGSARVAVQAPAPAPALISRGDIEVPNFKDPHAAFRKGSKLKGLSFAALVAAVAGGLFYLTPPQSAVEANTVELRDLRANAVIGSSVSPDIIPDPKNLPLEQRRKQERVVSEPAPSAQKADSAGFASSFKSQAQ